MLFLLTNGGNVGVGGDRTATIITAELASSTG